MFETVEDDSLTHAAHVLSLQEMYQWSMPVFEDVFGLEIKQHFQKKLLSNNFDHVFVSNPDVHNEMLAALSWIELRKTGSVSEADWKEKVLINDSWWAYDRSGMALYRIISKAQQWEKSLYEAVYSSGGLAVVTGVLSDPMVPHRVSWSELFPDWYPGPVYSFPMNADINSFSVWGLKYQWVAVVLPLCLVPVLQTILTVKGHVVRLETVNKNFKTVFDILKNNPTLETEIVLSLPSVASIEEAIIGSMHVSRIVYNNCLKS